MLDRTPLLLSEWQQELKDWKKSRKSLKRRVKKLHRKVEKKATAVEREGPREGENGEQFGNRLLNTQDKIRRRVFKKHREKLVGLQSRETNHFNDYVAADRRRRRVVKLVRSRR